VELAAEFGYAGLPTTDVDDLATWFNRGAKRNDLVLYLETFAHTVGVMQHRDAIERVAFECAHDLAEDGVVYAEVRFAPELHTEAGLTLDEVVEAVVAGFSRGSEGTDLTIYAICSAMRQAAHSLEIAEVAVRHRDAGVVGFDIAGPEAVGYAAHFMQDGIFWEFLAYCAGTGGSILIIGSAAGVAAMGMEKIDFIWYMKNISLLALIGYLAGAAAFYLQATYIL
jgi:adenosine deaminase